ncbi:unnamed protein product [Peronospora destructor]|uniref:Uncharacterized protein n=1 Tax=Peronospora destructor TaxID=86335 RepID=A0AAV0VEE5_9STRA|nr:unnamed protein product [Peronospora destructor]CAI5746858.1 unnamed protein product [Peronospora destructor]
MSRLLSSLAVCTLAICLASAASSTNETWSKQFKSKINVLPKPSGNCFVCFYEQTNFVGPTFCVGKSAECRTEVNPILVPLTIKSIKFGKDCNLVVNVRLMDLPFDEHIAVISEDVANADYNSTTLTHSLIQEVYVEEAGRACFLGVPKSGKGYGVCYSDNVPVVEDEYRNSFTELMLFKTATKSCDVIAYENEYYNSRQTSVQNDVNTVGLEQRFSSYSKLLKTNEIDPISGIHKTLQNKVGSFRFVSTNVH